MSGCPDWPSSNKCTRFRESSFGARISSKIIADIRLGIQFRVDYNCCNEPFADSSFIDMFLDMHGLIFYLSISPLAGSTRYLGPTETVERNEGVSRSSTPEPPTFQPGRILMHEHRNFHKHPFKTVSRAQELEVNIKLLSRVRKTSDHVDH